MTQAESGTKRYARMLEAAGRFWRERTAQNLTEYTLLMAFVVLGGVALFMGAGGDVGNIWGVAGSRFEQAQPASTTSPSTPPGSGDRRHDDDHHHH